MKDYQKKPDEQIIRFFYQFNSEKTLFIRTPKDRVRM